MPEEATPAIPATEPTAVETPKAVPYERFQEVNDQHRSLKQQFNELQTKLREREEADMTDVERERAQRERLEQENAALKGELTKTQRSTLLIEAARQAGYVDPSDAASMIDVTSVETEAQARRAVRDLAERKKHLLKEQAAPPEIGRVLKDGDLVDQARTSRDIGAQMDARIREAAGRGL